MYIAQTLNNNFGLLLKLSDNKNIYRCITGFKVVEIEKNRRRILIYGRDNKIAALY